MDREYLMDKAIDAVHLTCEANGAAESFYEMLQYIEKLESDRDRLTAALKSKDTDFVSLECELQDLASEIKCLGSRQRQIEADLKKVKSS